MAATGRTGRPTKAQALEIEHRLREAAVEVFLERGFDGTTMEDVARTAGITKRTLYAKYADKQTLFAEVLPWAMGRLHWEEPDLPDEGHDLREALLAIGWSVIERARDPYVSRLTRMLTAEAHRFPEFAVSARSLAWSPRMRTVMRLLHRHAEDGTIEVADLELTAEQFLVMAGGLTGQLAAFGLRRDTDAERTRLEHAVDLFLRGVLPRS